MGLREARKWMDIYLAIIAMHCTVCTLLYGCGSQFAQIRLLVAAVADVRDQSQGDGGPLLKAQWEAHKKVPS